MSPQTAGALTFFGRAALGVSTALLVVTSAPTIARKVGRSAASDTSRPAAYVKGRVRDGTEVIAFFIASSTCGASQNRNLPSALLKIRNDLAERAHSEGKRFVYAGIALDESAVTGLSFLKPFGPFDEVMAGGSWLGTGAVDFLIRGMPGPLALPQLLVVERDVKASQTAIKVSADRVMSRNLGFVEIFRFAGLSDSGTVIR
jgi:hypothetical protein